jgi:deoxyribonuclease V
VLAERTAVVPRVAPYRLGQFYLRELPPLRAVLHDLSGMLGLLVVDDYADLDPAGRPGLGLAVAGRQLFAASFGRKPYDRGGCRARHPR